MKEKILELRRENKTYREIADTLGIPFQRVEYYCSPDRKESLAKSYRKYAARNRLQKKVASFHGITKVREKTSFTYREFLGKVGERPSCYITKQPIDLNDKESYSIDHKIPKSRGGTNSIDNAEIILSKINRMKQDMTPQELFDMCQFILEKNGYHVYKI